MRTMGGKLLIAVVALSLGCAGGEPATMPPVEPGGPPTPPPGAISIALGSVTLGDDCGPAPETGFAAPPPGAGLADCAMGDDCNGGCQQSTLQLLVQPNQALAPSQISITRVELLDDQGHALGDLTPRAPKVWTEGAYVPWSGRVVPGPAVVVSYDLSAPDWSKLGGSRHAAQGRTFVVRVTAKVGDRDVAVETKLVSPVITPDPPIVT